MEHCKTFFKHQVHTIQKKRQNNSKFNIKYTKSPKRLQKNILYEFSLRGRLFAFEMKLIQVIEVTVYTLKNQITEE